MTEAVSAQSGEKIVIRLYVIIVVLAGIMGYVIGAIRPENLQPALFGVVALPPTPFGVAIYGVTTVGFGLGVLLVLVVYVSRRVEDSAAGE